MFRIACCALSFLLAISPAAAQRWHMLSASAEMTMLADTQSIEIRAGGIRTVTAIFIFAEGVESSAAMEGDMEVRCEERSWRRTQIRVKDADNNVVRTIDQQNDWGDVNPGSPGEKILRFACTDGAEPEAIISVDTIDIARIREILAKAVAKVKEDSED
jgi:hypothetical protein